MCDFVIWDQKQQQQQHQQQQRQRQRQQRAKELSSVMNFCSFFCSTTKTKQCEVNLWSEKKNNVVFCCCWCWCVCTWSMTVIIFYMIDWLRLIIADKRGFILLFLCFFFPFSLAGKTRRVTAVEKVVLERWHCLPVQLFVTLHFRQTKQRGGNGI